MAEDCVDQAATLARLPDRPCVTKTLRIHGHERGASGPLRVYGSDARGIRDLAASDPGLSKQLHPALPYVAAEVVWAVRHEMARTLEDVLGRRLRALFLNSRAAMEMAERVAELMGVELGWNAQERSRQVAVFRSIATAYMLPGDIITG
jgi:glycerol-3-phosphate dehydrogenase